ncbi:glucan biosynthesis protein [Methylovirgula sp. HY1]|jgi:glucans biosynthesis protein|uniref:glucan biosynthesis protein n=1 Tax=Methylovirgula sp. HY1 TaxID=2822761 RepID=UPI001C5B4066|nr:glucan biosynthesis protein D [Methylovirgula sp. HY1]
MFERRDVLRLGLGGLAAGVELSFFPSADGAEAPAAQQGFALGAPTPFHPGAVAAAAREAAKQPYKKLPNNLPDRLRNLTYDQYVAIRVKSSARIWANENLGFALEPLHRGFIFSAPVEINLVSQGQSRRVIYNNSQFDFGKLGVPSIGDIGFSGFRVLVPQSGQKLAEIATFQGASFFRAIAQGQRFGTMARALSIKVADPRGEEFPTIRTFWVERPSLATNALVIHALIDSQSVTGAYRFTLHPGEATIIDTECTLFARTKVDNFGLATMSSTVLSDAIDHRRPDDTRPIIADIAGLQMYTGKGEWLWRPVSNRETLQISTFVDENPRGFGFLQRDRRFADYQDDDQHWELRPSLWIEPIGDWGAGGMELIEIPSDSEANDNIIAYWRPQQSLAAGSETAFAYRQFWCWNPPERPALAIVTDTRSGRGSTAKRRRFLVEFKGGVLGDPQQSAAAKPVLTAAPGTITLIRTYPAPNNKSYRILFEIDPGNETSSELRLVLEVAGKPISETWLYRWTR